MNSQQHVVTPLMPAMSALASDRCTPDHVEERVDAEHASIDIVEAYFLDFPVSLERVQYIQHSWWMKSSFQ